MTTAAGTLQFHASANLQRLIGRELVPSDELALVELVKNAYDSGATHVTLTIQPDTQREPGRIEIRDNGEGMTADALRRLFMFAGHSSRPEQLQTAERVPTGEKGIGRFASDKLGRRLTVVTRARGSRQALRVEIDWKEFEKKGKRFEDISVPYWTMSPTEANLADSGTVLEIGNLRSHWPRERLDSLRQWLSDLFDPYLKPPDFRVDLVVPGSEKLSAPIQQEPPTGPDVELSFTVLATGKIRREVRLKVPRSDAVKETLDSTTTSEPLKGLSGRFAYYFKKPSRALVNGLSPGVRLFRDGFRIQPFGSRGADWLGVEEHRAKRAGHAHIVPTRLFGFVEIHRRSHPNLVDTTSRQALLEGEDVSALVTFLRGQLEHLERLIRTKISEPRWQENQKKRAAEFEQARLHTLSIMSFGIAHELRQPLQAIRSEADNIRTRLLQLHIDDEDINQAQTSIDDGVARIERNIDVISSISKGSIDDHADFDLVDWIEAECGIWGARLAPEGIELITNLPRSQPARLSKAAVATVLFNILKNATDAVAEVRDSRRGRIIVSLSRTAQQHRIEISDNGPGISDEIRPKLFRKFASKKTGGMGVGLYFCKSVVEACGGTIAFDSTPGQGATFRVALPDASG